MTKQLLSENRKALQFLHHAKGFDFEKPYNIVRKVGRFTSRTVAACVPDGQAAVILLKPIESRRRSYACMYYVELGSAGTFYPLRKDGVKYWNYSGIDYLFSKGDFEEIRKNETECIYIITQALEHLKPRKESSLDLSDRLDMTEVRRWGDGHGNTYIGSVYLKSRQHNMQPVEYKTDCKPATAADVIDKSGYMVCSRRCRPCGPSGKQILAVRLPRSRRPTVVRTAVLLHSFLGESQQILLTEGHHMTTVFLILAAVTAIDTLYNGGRWY